MLPGYFRVNEKTIQMLDISIRQFFLKISLMIGLLENLFISGSKNTLVTVLKTVLKLSCQLSFR